MKVLLLLPLLLAVRPAPPQQPANAQVRIALSLTTWQKFTPHGAQGKSVFRPAATRKLTLRAALDRPSHFYVGDWHFVTRPVFWSRQTRKYKTQLTIFQRLGKERKVEEKIGTLMASGTLKAYRDLYILQNFQKKTFKDGRGHPRLRVVAGFTDNSKHQGVAAAPARRR